MSEEVLGSDPVPHLATPPARVVSLVPSMTDSLFELGFGERVVGVTSYCRPPARARDRLVVVGGTKSVDVETVLNLSPDLVIANREENTREAVEALREAGLTVWVTFPCTVDEALRDLRELIGLFRAAEVGLKLETLERAVEWARLAAGQRPPVRVFVPIWRGETDREGLWWMTFNRRTYAHDVLVICGGENVFAERERRYPLAADLGDGAPRPAEGRDTRYPRVRPEEVLEAEPEVILLPDEPYAFGPKEEAELRERLVDTPAVQAGRVHRIDGSLLTWHGTRLGKALKVLPTLLQVEA